ncbi:CAMK protein kinase [Kwoniella mangroviensis CBS 8886]|nr:CAMK protein kinase [Kwoniella mangroviensis CBS 8886]
MSQSLPQSQRYDDYTFEPTQLSQPYFSQTQNSTFANSQVEPRRKYWAIFIPTQSERDILKIPWSKPSIQLGRGPRVLSKNDVILPEKRISNIHCKITLGIQGPNGSGSSIPTIQSWKDGEAEPEVWLEDLKSSNGTFINGTRVTNRRMLIHGDEISLGHSGTLDNHDVRYIFRSVGGKGAKMGQGSSKHDMVGAVYERYQVLGRLGKGTFAEVRKAVDVETGALRAIKQIIKHRFAGNDKTLEFFHREIEITKSLEHENICRLLDYYEDPQHICLVLEYIDGGDLLDYIMNWPNETGGGLPEHHAAELSVQICRAMAYTHSMGVTHRDLKPENILLTRETSDAPVQVKIADFGLAKMVHAETMLTSMVGTPQYLAPEVVMQTKQQPGYENVVDSWSIGIIVYSMMTKALPFDEDGDAPMEKRIKDRYTQPADTELLVRLGISDLAIDFVSGLLAKDPRQRLTMRQALDHEWLSGPSSQISESQVPASQALGGDSVWSIESFDDQFPLDQNPNQDGYSSDPLNGNDANVDGSTEDIGRWSRPMTASGTNYESLGEYGSEESFSQPMGNLHLNTPLIERRLPPTNMKDQLPSSPPLSSSSNLPVMNVDLQQQQQQQQEEKEVDMDGGLPTPITPKLSNGNNEDISMNGNGNGHGNGTAMLITKRKNPDEIQGFSSGSLSPPPMKSEGDHQVEVVEEEQGEKEKRKKEKAKSTSPRTLPTRQSTRTSRPRKSMRLA